MIAAGSGMLQKYCGEWNAADTPKRQGCVAVSFGLGSGLDDWDGLLIVHGDGVCFNIEDA